MRGVASILIALAALAACTGPTRRTGLLGREIESLDHPTTESERTPSGEQERPAFVPQAPTGARLTDDWIQLTSNEWLMGTFESLRRDTVEFDSDKLGDVSFDWDDVREVRCKRPMLVLLDDGTVLEGSVRLIGDSLLIGNMEPRRISRSRIQAIIPESDGLALWRGRFTLSSTTRSGNTDQSDVSMYAFLRAESAAARWDTTYNGNWSESRGTQTANSHRATTRFDVYLSPQLYVVPFGADAFRDPFQNLAIRTTTYAGAGYDIYSDGDDELSVFVGPAWLYERRDSVAAGDEQATSRAAAVLGSRLAWEVTSDIDFSIDYRITSPFDEPAAWNHNLTTVLSIDLIDDFDLDIRFVWDRVNRPTADDNGVIPQPDDFRTVIGVAYSF